MLNKASASLARAFVTDFQKKHAGYFKCLPFNFLFLRCSTTADAILEFVSSLKDKASSGDVSANTVKSTPPQWIAGGLGIAGISALAASLADWLPAF